MLNEPKKTGVPEPRSYGTFIFMLTNSSTKFEDQVTKVPIPKTDLKQNHHHHYYYYYPSDYLNLFVNSNNNAPIIEARSKMDLK